MKQAFFVGVVAIVALAPLRAADSEEGFTTIFDGKSFAGWKTSIDNTNTWKIEDGAFVARGAVAHVFYVGDTNAFKNFELKVDVMTEPGSNGGIYFHTAYQEKGFPRGGIECQVNVKAAPKSHSAVLTRNILSIVERSVASLALSGERATKW